MNERKQISIFAVVTILSVVIWGACVIYVHAAIPAVYTNDNFWTSEHDAPTEFFNVRPGFFYGYTKTGKYFEQTLITNSLDIKLHRFSIDQAFFYVSDRGIIKANTDIAALSIYLSRVG